MLMEKASPRDVDHYRISIVLVNLFPLNDK